MDGGRFDRVTRDLARAATRRGVLRGAVSGLLGSLALHDATDATPRRRTVCLAAGVNCTRNGQCCTGKCERLVRSGGRAPRFSCGCEDGKTLCGRVCVDLQADPANCGACGNACSALAECIDGECVSSVPTSCSDFRSDPTEKFCSAVVGDREVIGCDSQYFYALDPSTVSSVPCTTNAQCVALGTSYGLDCSNPSNIECYCELGYYNGPDWYGNEPYECGVTSKHDGNTCPVIPGD